MASQALITSSELAQLSIPSNATRNVDQAAIDMNILRGSDEAKSRLSSRYVFPLLSWGYDLKGHVASIVTWHLLVRRGFNPDNASDKAAKDSYEAAIEWCDQVARLTIHPEIVDSSTGTPGFPQDPAPQASRGWKEWGQPQLGIPPDTSKV